MKHEICVSIFQILSDSQWNVLDSSLSWTQFPSSLGSFSITSHMLGIDIPMHLPYPDAPWNIYLQNWTTCWRVYVGTYSSTMVRIWDCSVLFFQDSKMEILYYMRLQSVEIFRYTGLTFWRYLQFRFLKCLYLLITLFVEVTLRKNKVAISPMIPV